MNKLYFHLVAFDIGLYYAWKKYFDGIEEVRISDGNILSFKACDKINRLKIGITSILIWELHYI